MSTKNDNNDNNNIIDDISSEYISKINELTSLSTEISNFFVDRIFNIKISLSILKGGIPDFQKGNVKSEIYDEIKNIKENLSACTRLVLLSRNKVEEITKIRYKSKLKDKPARIKQIEKYAKDIDNFILIFKNKVLDKEFSLLNEVEDISMNRFTDNFVNDWHSQFFSTNNIGFNMIISNKKRISKMNQHIIEYRKNMENEAKIQEILKEFSMGKTIGDEVKKIDLSYINPGTMISKDLFDESGKKLKSAYETITKKDLDFYKKNNINNLYLESPKTNELNPSDYRIVVIDDNKSTTKITGEWLKMLGFKVKLHNEPIKALVNLLREDFPDLLILDFRMPKMDGITFIENLKATRGEAELKLPVIVISALAGESHIRRAIEVGATDYLTKPIKYELLMKKISKILVLSNLKDS